MAMDVWRGGKTWSSPHPDSTSAALQEADDLQKYLLAPLHRVAVACHGVEVKMGCCELSFACPTLAAPMQKLQGGTPRHIR